MTTKHHIEPKDKFFTPALSSMRETAFGADAQKLIRDVVRRSDRGRDDDQLIADAAAKRLRKAQKRLGL